MFSGIVLLLASLPPYLFINEGALQVSTPQGQTIIIPDGSTFTGNSLRIRLDVREITIDNVSIFRDGFE